MSWRAVLAGEPGSTAETAEPILRILKNPQTESFENIENAIGYDNGSIQRPKRPDGSWPPVIWRYSLIGEPIVLVSRDEDATHPSVVGTGYPVFTRDELERLRGADPAAWRDAVIVKRSVPSARVVSHIQTPRIRPSQPPSQPSCRANSLATPQT